jgi:hypothetical protein
MSRRKRENLKAVANAKASWAAMTPAEQYEKSFKNDKEWAKFIDSRPDLSFAETQQTKADSRVGVRDDAVLEGKTRKKLRKSEQLRAQRRSTRRLRVGGNLSIGTKGDSGVGTGGSKKSSLNIPKG